MQFTVESFLFFCIVLLLFYLIRVEGRLYLLCLASIIYPFTIDRTAGIVVLLFSLIVYSESLLIGKLKSVKLKKVFAFLSVFSVVGVWIFLKNVIWFNRLSVSGQMENSILYKVVIPIGFSFYAFQAIGYIVDIYKGKTEVILNPALFHLYMAWFPRFVSGPIERAGTFFEETKHIFKVKLFENNRLKISVSYILVGGFYKILVADRLAPVVNNVFSAPNHYSGTILILASLLYTMQIYCDFAGYSMYVIGISNLFGIRLVENFQAPYLSKNIKEFWDRWHISLTRWFGDYLYVPLGGNRKGLLKKYVNVMIVFIVSGVWHGSGLAFIAWGMLHGGYNIASDMISRIRTRVWTMRRTGEEQLTEEQQIVTQPVERKNQGTISNVVVGQAKAFSGWLITFCAVSFAWIFFKTESLMGSLRYIGMMLVNRSTETFVSQLETIGIMEYDYWIYVIMLLIVLCVDLIIYKVGLEKFVSKVPLIPWFAATWMFIMSILIYGTYGPTAITEMIYMNF